MKRCASGAIPNHRGVKRGVEKAAIYTRRCVPVVGQAHGCAICMKLCPVQRYGLARVIDDLELPARSRGGAPKSSSPITGPSTTRSMDRARSRDCLSASTSLGMPTIRLPGAGSRKLTAREIEQLKSWS